MKKSLAYAQANPDEVRSVLDIYTKIAAEVTLLSWPEEINKESVQKRSDLAQQEAAPEGARPDRSPAPSL